MSPVAYLPKHTPPDWNKLVTCRRCKRKIRYGSAEAGYGYIICSKCAEQVEKKRELAEHRRREKYKHGKGAKSKLRYIFGGHS